MPMPPPAVQVPGAPAQLSRAQRRLRDDQRAGAHRPCGRSAAPVRQPGRVAFHRCVAGAGLSSRPHSFAWSVHIMVIWTDRMTCTTPQASRCASCPCSARRCASRCARSSSSRPPPAQQQMRRRQVVHSAALSQALGKASHSVSQRLGLARCALRPGQCAAWPSPGRL